MGMITVQDVLDKLPRWRNGIPRGDLARDIEMKLVRYGKGYDQLELQILMKCIDDEVKRLFDRGEAMKNKRRALKAELLKRYGGYAR
jgi:hypothetical protein